MDPADPDPDSDLEHYFKETVHFFETFPVYFFVQIFCLESKMVADLKTKWIQDISKGPEDMASLISTGCITCI